jgi:hypothetical protein
VSADNLPPGVTDFMLTAGDPTELRRPEHHEQDDYPVDEWTCDWCDTGIGWSLGEGPDGPVLDWLTVFEVPDGQMWCEDCHAVWQDEQE